MAETWLLGAATAYISANETALTFDMLGATVVLDGSQQNFAQTVSQNLTVERISVTLDFASLFLSDVDLFLIGPDGARIELLADDHGSADCDGIWTFDAQSSRGVLTFGDWTIEAGDDTATDPLTLRDVDITFYGTVETNDRYIFTDEFSDYGALNTIIDSVDTDGGLDVVNGVALTTNAQIYLDGTIGLIDSVRTRISGVENAIGGDGNDRLLGGEGNDTLYSDFSSDNATLSADVLDGGTGKDTVSYAGEVAGVVVDLLGATISNENGASGDTLIDVEAVFGTDFADGIHGDTFNNEVRGQNGNDLLVGRDGIDSLYGGDGNDTLNGGNGGDVLDGGNGNRDLAGCGTSAVAVLVSLTTPGLNTGEAASDIFTGIEGLIGSSSNDTLIGNTGANVLDGYLGDDRLDGGSGNDSLGGHDGNDTLIGGAGADTRDGGNGNDQLIGEAGADSLFGEFGNDVFVGDAGADAYNGGTGNHTLDYSGSLIEGVTADLLGLFVSAGTAAGDSFADVEALIGTTFTDDLLGFSGNDSLYGGAGNDALYGSARADLLDGGAGSADGANYDSSAAGVRVDLVNFGVNTGEAAGDRFSGIERVLGTNFNDTVAGTAGNDVFTAYNGADVLSGFAGTDTLFGHDGNDLLDGGSGNDVLNGGAGADSFVFAAATGAINIDSVVGFSVADDTIWLETRCSPHWARPAGWARGRLPAELRLARARTGSSTTAPPAPPCSSPP